MRNGIIRKKMQKTVLKQGVQINVACCIIQPSHPRLVLDSPIRFYITPAPMSISLL